MLKFPTHLLRTSICLNSIFFLSGLLLLICLLIPACRDDYSGDEGFTVRRVEANWPQIYHPFAVRPPINCEPFDTRYVYDFNPPLYFALVRIMAGAHPGRLALRLFSILPALAMLILLAVWASRRHSMLPAAITALVICMAPPILGLGHEARPYPLAMLLATGILIYLDSRIGNPRLIFPISLCLALAGCLLHYHFVWLILAVVFLLIPKVFHLREHRREIISSLAGLGFGALLAFLCMAPVWPTFAWAKLLPSRSLSGLELFKVIFIPIIPWEPANTFQTIIPFAAALLFCLVLALLLTGGKARESGSRRQAMTWLALWLIPAIAPALARIFFGQPFFERYALFAFPGWMMLLCWMISEAFLRSRTIKTMATILVLLIIAGGIPSGLNNLRTRPQWRPALDAFYSAERPGDYYSVQPGWLKICFAANAGHPPRAAYTPINKGFQAGAHRLWIISPEKSEAEMKKQLPGKGWTVNAVSQGEGVWLWRAER